MDAKQWGQYQKWISQLEKELHELTMKHGYGKLPKEAGFLAPNRLTTLVNTEQRR